jgi:hypothetical protein
LDVRDLETSQLIGLIILYTILEPLIFKWIGQDRENSIFCIPYYKADESLAQAVELVRSVIADEANKSKLTFASSKKFARYAALNLNALHKYGSVEFRHMRTTHDFDRVVDWINIIQSLKAATFKLPTSDGAILRLAKNTEPNAFLAHIFGYELAAKLWSQEAPDLIRGLGVSTAKDLVLHGLTTKLWQEVQIPDGKHEGFTKYMAAKPAEEPKPQGKVQVNIPPQYQGLNIPNQFIVGGGGIPVGHPGHRVRHGGRWYIDPTGNGQYVLEADYYAQHAVNVPPPPQFAQGWADEPLQFAGVAVHGPDAEGHANWEQQVDELIAEHPAEPYEGIEDEGDNA